jgi:hypothetical protein
MALDLSKAFDKMNHHALFIKLMKRHFPLELIIILEKWFSSCYTCVNWYGVKSLFFSVNIGVRQGGVLSPLLFAIYLDDAVKNVCSYGLPLSIVLYADDIMLLSSSLITLQKLLSVCEKELIYLGMSINVKKSCCLRIGSRCNASCENLTITGGLKLPWVEEIRYLGIYIIKGHCFKCSLNHAKRSFYRSANSIFGKIGRVASEEVVLDLIAKKCIPVLIYGLETCTLNATDQRSINYPVIRFLMKLFKTCNTNLITDVQLYFNFLNPSVIVAMLRSKFLSRFNNSDNMLCKICAMFDVNLPS